MRWGLVEKNVENCQKGLRSAKVGICYMENNPKGLCLQKLSSPGLYHFIVMGPFLYYIDSLFLSNCTRFVHM